jgi:hypothetical protein
MTFIREESKVPVRKPIVFVPQMVAGRNLSAALKFGSIVSILNEDPSPFALGPAIEELRRTLAGYMPHDYILLMGDPVVIGMSTMISSQQTGGVVNLLKFDRQSFDYIPVTVDIR